QQHGEFLSAVARGAVRRTQFVVYTLRHGANHRVAGRMPPGVVDRLEAVDVEHKQRARTSVAARALELLAQQAQELTAVEKPGEPVARGELGKRRLVLFDALGHGVERRRQVAQLVGASRADAVRQFPARKPQGALAQSLDVRHDRPREAYAGV